ncbi:flagellar biosynthesis protein FlgN [Lutimaribacter sp. EGI FJ00014]|uniref:Flagellar biosynthesis protein FlgN n=1 Tax=Lutimaribacter degradans TaxID=2945989 RepID=A0ACC5ZVA7_9RHOB|nr:flagellar biosynthesis protein FlgN [Lutimaribacter sp. EGI FJ00013]MCM2561888.1 flagellar biosynthesis protein FlgN [Lutimaribacter sp. EGI FJ00013]MCO0635720.1 flagellar biosynthesis protein FlgN [Lutimaribacter sp. EGI FJ00014]
MLAGDVENLARLAEEKEKLVNTLAKLPKSGLDGLQAKAKRNQELFDSALKGINAVTRRLQALRDVRSALNTYDQSGNRQSIDGMHRPSVERRA